MDGFLVFLPVSYKLISKKRKLSRWSRTLLHFQTLQGGGEKGHSKRISKPFLEPFTTQPECILTKAVVVSCVNTSIINPTCDAHLVLLQIFLINVTYCFLLAEFWYLPVYKIGPQPRVEPWGKLPLYIARKSGFWSKLQFSPWVSTWISFTIHIL